MIILAITLFIILLNYFLIVKTNKKIVLIPAIVLLPLAPSITGVWLELQKEEIQFILQFLESGSFYLSIMAFPVILWLPLWFGMIYSAGAALLIIEFFLVRRWRLGTV
ncbi:hypothetical protein GKZ89_09705 [Bacillus mangrovi]|uniref:Uncharacterized protein n=1 Tax=Metabacillus mangrovi TaxID=1491830 RepID=A0A7X2S5K0_9BACI|nr:hypothetical protein [Metabacillus mangrovi]MTH53678.1 hypothetical protein [Metabacillus mangrovi]